MEHALELPQDVDALKTLVVTHRQWLAERETTIASQRDEIARLEQRNRMLAKLVFGPTSEKRVPTPTDPSLQGNLVLANIPRLREPDRVLISWRRSSGLRHTQPVHESRGSPNGCARAATGIACSRVVAMPRIPCSS